MVAMCVVEVLMDAAGADALVVREEEEEALKRTGAGEKKVTRCCRQASAAGSAATNDGKRVHGSLGALENHRVNPCAFASHKTRWVTESY